MKCISVPVVADQICRELFPMFWSDGMVCAGQVDTNNCLVRTEVNDPISSASASDLPTSGLNLLSFYPPERQRQCDGVRRAAAGHPLARSRVLEPARSQHVHQNMQVHPLDQGYNAEKFAHLNSDSAADHPACEKGCRGGRGPPIGADVTPS